MFFFFFNDTATTEIYTLSLHDALPICLKSFSVMLCQSASALPFWKSVRPQRSEEHTSELQSRPHLVCRLLLEKKNPCSKKSSGLPVRCAKYWSKFASLLPRILRFSSKV